MSHTLPPTNRHNEQYLPKIEKAGVNLVYVVIGTPENAREFAKLTGFPIAKLYCDPEAETYKLFGFSRGFLPDVPINPYLKLLPMLAGIGSPGTIQVRCDGGTAPLAVKARNVGLSSHTPYTQSLTHTSLPQAVLRGYVGDKEADASWTGSYLRSGRERTLVDKSAFDVLGKDGERVWPYGVAWVESSRRLGSSHISRARWGRC